MGGNIFSLKIISFNILRLYTEFQPFTMPRSGQIVPGGGWVGGGVNLF